MRIRCTGIIIDTAFTMINAISNANIISNRISNSNIILCKTLNLIEIHLRKLSNVMASSYFVVCGFPFSSSTRLASSFRWSVAQWSMMLHDSWFI